MSRNIIRALPFFVNGKKIAAVTHGSYDLASGAEMALGAVDGYLGHINGWPTVKVVPSVIVPVKGIEFAVESFILDEVSLSIGIPINGRFHQVDVRAVGTAYRWDWKTGSVSGDLTFEGGPPVMIGNAGVV